MTLELSNWNHFFEPGDASAPVFLTLHGTGGTEADIAQLGAALDPTAGILSVRGRVSEHGMNRWFARRAEGVFDLDDVELRADELASFIRLARSTYEISDRRLVAVGFSNGANIALATALRHPDAIDTVIAFSGMYPLGDRIPQLPLSGSRALLINGVSDPMAPSDSVARAQEVLEAGGATVDRVSRGGGHGIFPSDLAAAQDWLGALPPTA